MDYLSRVFHRETGDLRRELGAGYEPRLQQGQMALAVDDAIERASGVIIEAPTGSGKSLSYLIPAAHHTTTAGTRAVVATANIALQEQLFTKDLPLVKKLFPALTYALVKGKNNYLCPLQLQQMQSSLLDIEFSVECAQQARDVLSWAKTTETGDRSELDFEPATNVWSRFAVGSDECLGKQCRAARNGECFILRSRQEASEAQIIVTNFHLLLLDASSGKALLPPYQILIVDEGHELPHVARSVLGFSLTASRLKRVIIWLDTLHLKEQTHALKVAARAFYNQMKDISESKEYHVRLRAPLQCQSENLSEALVEAENALSAAAESDSTVAGTATLAQTAVKRIRDELRMFVEACDLKHNVYWIEQHGSYDVSLESRVLDPSAFLHTQLFQAAQSYVVTSATLTSGGNFAFMLGELGLPTATRMIRLASPFNTNRACFYVPESIASPGDVEFADCVAQELLKIVDITGGGVLGLFTSWKNMQNVARSIGSSLGDGNRLLMQGTAPRHALLQRFRSTPHSILLGVASFWQGIDIPGEALVAVVMDKIPFPSPIEPLIDAMHDALGPNAFARYDLPLACIRIQQGAGRLLRATSDFGIIALLDRRVITSGYGRKILQSLQPMSIVRTTNDLRNFFERVRNE